MDKPKRAIASQCNNAFSLGLDQKTFDDLKKLQVNPVFILKGDRQPSRTLITRAAIQFYASAVDQAKAHNKSEWLNAQKAHMQHLAKMGTK